MNTGIIYKYTNKINGKVYIGQTIHPKERYSRHKLAHSDVVFHRAIRKYGFENFEYDVIEEIPEEYLNEREIFWISFYDSHNPEKGYNETAGGEGKRNFICNTKIKEKISNTLKERYKNGMKAWNTGKHMSEEIKKKISISSSGKPSPNKGKVMSEDSKKKISISHLGLHLSEETKSKISESLKGHPGYIKGKPAHNRKPILMLDKNTEQLIKKFDCLSDVKKAGFSISAVSQCLTKKHKTSSGYKWIYQ